MKRIVNVDADCKCNATKAIEKFFKKYPELAEAWKETLEWMNESDTEHFVDDLFADGTKNNDWTYSLWLVKNEAYTYIAVIERA